MARKGKLLSALDRHKGRDIRLEKQRTQEKSASKRRALAQGEGAEDQDIEMELGDDFENGLDSAEQIEDEAEEDGGVSLAKKKAKAKGGSGMSLKEQLMGIIANPDEVSSADEQDLNDLEASSTSGSEIGSDEADLEAVVGQEAENGEVEDDEEGIPLSDLESAASSDKGDIVPYQRLTINNTTALTKAYHSIAHSASAPFSTFQVVTSTEPVEIKDVNDDLSRELAFYKQCLDAATEARRLLRKEGVPFSRPTDFFAEMVKTDEHMSKIRAKMVEKESDKKASAEARKLRDLKKFGKQVQVAKLQEREKAKKQTLDKINQLKRKRNVSSGDTRDEDLFDVALEDPEKPAKARSGSGRKNASVAGPKRQHKNEKYGFGGKKRFKKSGDAVSSGDLSGFSAKKMKAGGGKTKRLGKSRRAKIT